VALSPYLPETAPRILGALRQPVDVSLEQVAYGKAGATDGIEPAAPLFPRVDLPTVAA
jgi:methionyl-tRNA synthetase